MRILISKIQNWILISLIFLLNSCSSDTLKTTPIFPATITWLNQAANFPFFENNNKLILFEFFTDHCDACIELSANLKKVKENYSKHITILGIYTPSQLLTSIERNSLLNQLRINFPVIYDKDAKLFNLFHLQVWPTLILANSNRKIIMQLHGAQSKKLVEDTIQKNLKDEGILT